MQIGGKNDAVTGAYTRTPGSVGIILPSVHTFATLPLFSNFPTCTFAYTSDLGPCYSDGVTGWYALGSGGGGLGPQVATNTANITGLQTQYGTLNTTVTNQGTTIGTLSGQISGLQGQITTNSNSITSLNTTVSGYSTSIATANTNASNAVATANAVSAVAGVRRVALSTFAGVYPDQPVGGIDSWAGLKNALAYVANQANISNTTYTLDYDCSIYVKGLYDNTRAIFIEPNVSINFSEGALCIYDHVGFPVFTLAYTNNNRFYGLNFSYQGPSIPLNILAAYPGSTNSYKFITTDFNDTILTNYMHNTARINCTFAGGYHSSFIGSLNCFSPVYITGSTNDVAFYNPRFTVPAGTTADKFIAQVISGSTNWIPGTTINSGTNTGNITTANSVAPYDVHFYNLKMDGYLMGVQGAGASFFFHGGEGLRYSDLQSSTGAGVGGYSLSTGTYPCTDPWFSPPHAFYIQDISPTFFSANPIYCQRGIFNFVDRGYAVGFQQGMRTPSSGTLFSLKCPSTNDCVVDGYTTYRPHGGVTVITYTAGNQYGYIRNVQVTFDSSLTVIADQQAYNTGSLKSNIGMSFPANYPYVYTVISAVSVRDVAATSVYFPIQGSFQVGNANCNFSDFSVYMNDWSGSTLQPAFVFAGTNINVQMKVFLNSHSGTTTLQGCMAFETIATYTQQSSWDIKVYGWRSPQITFASLSTATQAPGGTLASNWTRPSGTYIIGWPDQEIRYGTFTTGSNVVTWPQALNGTVITFTTAPVNGASTATLSVGSQAALGNGSYAINVNNSGGGSTLYSGHCIGATFTLDYGETWNATATTTGFVSGSNPGLVANVQGLVYNDFDNQKQRIQCGITSNTAANYFGAGISLSIRVEDVTNNILMEVAGGIVTETVAYEWYGTPPASVSTYTLPSYFNIPAGFGLISAAWSTGTAVLGASQGLTSCNVITTGSTPVTLTNGSILPATVPRTGNTNVGGPVQAPTSLAGVAQGVKITANGGNFDGTGFCGLKMRVGRYLSLV